ncbi:type I-E CRISPR-associated protein Cas7/Cse4/CasC [Streptomyces ipomoeae]|uniref:type I-E CRISPR-associated protein Cas7/Cse4/CasC n=1 Tax=Streptomyces ipomoeae TaxID=103232 RepID=UPI0029A37A82|nr:type I-E CRISPR-associated protein Cas7/Cse4/CasC [Streptomyces ipomoeae]MDX2820462.1 type I-E CRISPR-associated protein Cas7/Cse4/CasC [Streptomyces ipomoeae]MDX2877332.1 type I-E CRISPR-associated protein Cas7/Cse4/CasC [Streptomyces ipomoeae]
MNRIFLDVHALQTVPPSNLNRDDTGAPKSAVYGGVPRARVSSQAWKRVTREYFGDEQLLDPSELGVRTKKVAELLATRITDLDASIEDADALRLAAEVIETATGSKMEAPERKTRKAKADAAGEKTEEAAAAPESKYLMFLSARQLDGLAALAVEGAADITAYLRNKDNKARAKQIADTRHSIDIALFGRMVADSADFNVDAAAQVAHAISVHRVENESDYYTAVDDKNTAAETGAGMIGTIDFNSATLYRYAAVSVHQLAANLGEGLRDDEPVTTPVRRAVEAFVHAFVASLPKGKINTFGHHTLPDAVVIKLRTTRPISFVAAFEEPVTAESGSGHLREASARLAEYIPEVERAYGDEQSTSAWVLRVGAATDKLASIGQEAPSLSALVEAIGQAVAERMEKPA